MKRYQIWDKKSKVITPIGEVLTPEQWIERYPMAGMDDIKLIIGGGTINGSVCMEFTQTVDMYEKMGCDFSACTTDEEILDAIEAFEIAMNTVDTSVASTDERIAAALEAQLMMNMMDAEAEEEEETEVTEEV